MAGNGKSIFFVFLHQSCVADDISKKDSCELAVLFLHNYPVRSSSTSGYFKREEVFFTTYNLNCAPTKMRYSPDPPGAITGALMILAFASSVTLSFISFLINTGR